MSVSMPRVYADNVLNDNTSSSRGKGGYFIDQNSNNPAGNAAMNSYNLVGGLCQICHGTAVNTMDYYPGSKMWRSNQNNGHANSTVGGTGTGGVNLFDPRRGVATAFGTTAFYGLMGNQGLAWMTPGPNSSPFNSGQPNPTATHPWGRTPVDQPGTVRATGWYKSGTAGGLTNLRTDSFFLSWYNDGSVGLWDGPGDTTGNKPHRFLCSKCHSPHATGLPALLITNCLDRTLGTWSSAAGSGMTVGPNASNANTTANNCHAKSSTSTGWHKLAPGHKWP